TDPCSAGQGCSPAGYCHPCGVHGDACCAAPARACNAEADTCVSGLCQTGSACPQGQSDCGTGCVDVLASAANCNACGHACPAGNSCCGGRCDDTATSVLNCGQCSVSGSAVCAPGQTCEGGHCSSTCGGVSCSSGQACCGETCTTLGTD